MSKTILTLIPDIYEVAYTGVPVGENVDKTIVEYATRSGEMMGKKLYAEERKTKDPLDRTIRMSELGTFCTRQLILKWYAPEYGAPPYTYKHDPTLGVKFGYGNLIEEFVLALAEAAGHSVSSKQEQVALPAVQGWTVKGSIDCIIDNVLVDVKSASKFAFDKYCKEGFTVANDSFGYSFQLQGYKHALNSQTSKSYDAKFLFVEKETGRIQLVDPRPIPKREIDSRVVVVGSAAEKYIAHGDLPMRVPTKAHKYGEQLDITCSYCNFKHACFPDMFTYVDRGRPVHITTPNAAGESFAKLNSKDIWRRPEKKASL